MIKFAEVDELAELTTSSEGSKILFLTVRSMTKVKLVFLRLWRMLSSEMNIFPRHILPR
jgi:hypothetical protein